MAQVQVCNISDIDNTLHIARGEECWLQGTHIFHLFRVDGTLYIGPPESNQHPGSLHIKVVHPNGGISQAFISTEGLIQGHGGGYPENSAAPGCASTVHFDYRSESSYSGQGGSLGGKKEYYESPACVFYNWLANLRRVL